METWEIPLSGIPQRFTIGMMDIPYLLNFRYRDADMGGWVLDISTPDGTDLVCGVPLITGADLLAQYAYLGFTVALVVISDGNASAVPTFANLGTGSHVYILTDELPA